jgi:hypothetical protein
LSALLTVAAIQPVWAASATATVSGFTIELIDLNPDDGIAPSLTLTGADYLSGHLYLALTDGDTQEEQSWELDDPFTPVSNALEHGTTATAASLTGNGTFESTTLWSTATAYGLSAPPPPYQAYAGATASTLPYYILSANTQVVFSYWVDLNVSNDDALNWADAATYARLYYNPEWGLYEDAGLNLYSGAQIGSWTLSDEITLSYSNLGADATRIALHVESNAGALAEKVLVPEPQTSALLLVGLAALGFAARRRLD